ncbi:E3 ubiquitin-protein ligase Praja-1-like isoform X2 [Carlito syrichta]|uniref:RING-type E3 ubiquitin transferase n=1 Tax=Carlito syrichta TaxID=1868482 RepID=A0A3Q0DWG9_CARSF|nr:E3 ubiquitin-protein ligase Praja-1-like isoform X2 [Carlito syrichta]
MGQEASKPELPKPAGGYQSSSGRMYGRRHAYVSSRPSTSQQERVASQGKTTSDIPVHRSAPSQTTKRSRSPFSTTRRRWDDSESSGTSLNIDNEAYSSTSRWRETAYGDEGHSNGPTRRGRRRSSSGFSESKHPEDKREERSGQMKPEKVPRRRRTVANPDFWTYGDDYYRFFEDDSDSDTGWVTALLRKYRSQEETLSSSSKSWETLSGNEEREPQESQVSARPNLSPSTSATAGAGAGSTGPNYLEEAREPPLQEDDQASLEEGEIPWLQYNDNESSSEGDNDSGPGLMHPGVFMLDGNSNVEDDSSVSEDLDVDWSLFDGFADGPGVAEAISYVDPQFLTYMALEERLTQAMETALEHLESLAVDVEVANPPASKESIDALPKILVTDDHGVLGQDMCCPICCSEYVKGEVATELPCHHYFHKPCVSIWLQKSGTCPVCRCMYPPQL